MRFLPAVIHNKQNEENQMSAHLRFGAVAVACLMLASCNGGGGGDNSDGIRPKALIAVPNVDATTNFSFDLGVVDTAKSRYYFTDRNNASVDVFDTRNNTLITQIKGFSGCNTGPSCNGANNDRSGPDGIDLITGTNLIFVGDVNSVKVVDSTTNTIVNTIRIGGTSGLRADEGCYDPDHKIYMISSPGEDPPFATFIDATTQKIIATMLFTDPGSGATGPASAGLEACAYDRASASFYVNNDGSTANPHGEIDVIPVSAVQVGTPTAPVTLTLPVGTAQNGFKVFPLGNCDPTGIVLGPGAQIASSCRQGTVGVPLTVQILDRNTGANLATVPVGGGDQITYDPASNRYYLAASRWTASGRSSGSACTAASPCTPVLAVIDASSFKVVSLAQTGNNAHSVAVDPVGRQLYLPNSSVTAPAGCSTCSDFPVGGVMVFAQ